MRRRIPTEARRLGVTRSAACFLILAALPQCAQPVPAPPEGVEIASADRVAALVAAAKGKALVVNLWATWCPPCVAEMPDLADFYRNRDSARVEFLSVSLDD
ncbi:MAG TPA: TlpA disulfide reductase family protein, partial [Candidatus Hydrogenedentes bacterium]|nr:TlpA disulfide reductase family protein [Candidatus Hydrogenedentota bacterium]